MEKIEAASAQISPKYLPKASEITEIAQASGGTLETVYNAFVFGFMQGQKTAHTEGEQERGRGLLVNVVTEPREAAHARYVKALAERERSTK
jgi:hypothetical protein